uniref:Protein RER1 n=1 Tax=Acrobeloides nanus TaxID=290746 RepID=A0A914DH39_9BILA
MYDSDDIRDKPSQLSRFFHSVNVLSQHYLDRLAPYTTTRWTIALTFIFIFCLRIILLQGFYIITYAMFIHLLALFLTFLTPLIDPALALDEEEEGPTLPTKNTLNDSDEFRPFMRRLPEFKFWESAMKTTAIAFCCTFFDFLDIPVFWPILVVYFVALTLWSFKQQIKHMIKYRYIPFNIGKPRRQSKDSRVNRHWKM